MNTNPSHENYLQWVQEALEHDKLYYEKATPIISDQAYDALIEEIKKYEKRHPDRVVSISPTQKVGGRPDFDHFIQKEHKEPLLSLSNTYSKQEVSDFIARLEKGLKGEGPFEYCAEAKVDGLAIAVTYENGHFVQAVTRGDGQMGDDVTHNVAQIKNLPHQIKMPEGITRIDLRGEVYMPKEAFESQNKAREKKGEPLWANPRNAAAGSLKLLDSRQVAKRGLAIVFYGLVDLDGACVPLQHNLAHFLADLGLPTLEDQFFARCKDVEEIMKFADKIHAMRSKISFDIDGVVVKLDKVSLRARLGSTNKAPRWAMAYKFSPERAMTFLRDITLQVGRSGVITPVAELDPVFVSGSTISRATLHNEEEIQRKDLRIGDFVYVEKGGDVIPKVVGPELSKRAPDLKPWKMQASCPACGAPLKKDPDGVAIRCTSKTCSDQQLHRLIFFASKAGLDIENLGKRVMEKLYERNLVRSFEDIYLLNSESLLELEGFAEKATEQLLASIEGSKEPKLSAFITALGIPHVGEQLATTLAARFKSIEKVMEASKEDLLEIEGVGPKVAAAIVEHFKEPRFRKEIERLLELGVKPKTQLAKQLPLSGLSFVITGKFEGISRKELSEKIRDLGGHLTSDITQKTDYLLVGEDAGSKLLRAKELSVKSLSFKEWEDFLSRHCKG